MFSNAFSWKEKFRLAGALSAFSRRPFKLDPALKTVGEFLDASRQGPQSRERFWIPVCNAVMNVPAQAAPIRGFGEVLHRVFFGNRKDSALLIPARPLSEIAFPSAASYLENRGSKVHLHEGVQTFQADDQTFEVTTRSGKTFSGRALIWAVPPSSLAALWPRETGSFAEVLPRLGKSPILSVHLILSRDVFQEPLLGLSGARFEWVFNRNANWNWKGEGQYLSFTSGGAEELARRQDKDLTALALEELRDRCPAAREARILHSKVTREMAATFHWNQETDSLRPPCETPFPHVFVAGDWTDTGLPATIEGACLSGRRAAEKCAAYLRQIT
jgi:zeta-carotene desaturase